MTFLSVGSSLRKQLPRERDPLLPQGNDVLDDFDDDLEDQNLDDDEKLLLRIKSSSDVQIYARPSDTIAKVKVAVLHALDKASSTTDSTTTKSDPYVRLIASGRLLAPDTAQLSEFVLESGQVVHAVVANERGAQAALAAGPVLSRRALRGTGIDASGLAVRRNEQEEEEESVEEDESDLDLEQGGRHHRHRRLTRRGFDRLRDTVGLRRSEVAAIRAYFSRSVDRWIRQNPEAAEQAAAGETDLVRRRLLQEDAWMESQGPASEFRLNLDSTAAALSASMTGDGRSSDVNLWRSGGMSASVGTDRDFMWGFMLGFFVGFLMLLWVWMPTVPHKQKLGILTGISLQLAFGLWRGSGESTDDLVLAGDY